MLQLENLEIAASMLRAMSHPKRITIIELLAKSKRLSVTEIYKKLSIEQPTASNHLNILKNKGILDSKREGKKIFYSLKHEKVKEIIDSLDRCIEI
ncbi:MAG: helix-turn-helix transcriptional regulator [Bacteroidales bacterium]|nr:helix-turn-helix transcriptional regulator [Bacteroidota bacterium]MBL6949404.1 helix-turn-helix transcriptional regulator [Bacteroidales bacterium]